MIVISLGGEGPTNVAFPDIGAPLIKGHMHRSMLDFSDFISSLCGQWQVEDQARDRSREDFCNWLIFIYAKGEGSGINLH